MGLTYPENSIWYVEASQADGSDQTCGSAVAVWLQRTGQPKTCRKYLLTCAHVVRGQVPDSKAKDRDAGYGPLPPMIKVWQPGKGFNPASGTKAVLANFNPRELDQERLPIRDWLALDVDGEIFQGTAGTDTVGTWTIAEMNELMIAGYPM